MKKKIFITVISIFFIYLGIFFTDFLRVKFLKTPIFAIKQGHIGSMDRFNGLGYTIGLDYNSKKEITYGQLSIFKFVILRSSNEMNSRMDLIGVFDTLNNCKLDTNNISYWTVDQAKDIILIGMIDTNDNKREELYNKCFNKKQINYIKSNNLIEFQKTMHIFDARIIEVKENSLLVLSTTNNKYFKKNERVVVFINDNNELYEVGAIVKITYNDMINESLPPQINASKIELINT